MAKLKVLIASSEVVPFAKTGGLADVVGALPAALARFNGFYTETGPFIIENPIHNLIALGSVVAAFLGGFGYMIFRYFRKRAGKRSVK